MTSKTFIFFDVDGVLIDGYHFNPIHRKMWDDTIEQDLGLLKTDLQSFFQTYWPSILTGQKDLREELQKFLKSLEYPLTARDIMDYWFQKDSKINHQVLAKAKAWKYKQNTKLFLATNQEKYRADFLMNNLGFAQVFDDIFFSGALGLTKDSPDFFNQITQKLAINLTKDHVIYFDDTPKCLAAAQKAGWSHVILVETAQDIAL